MKDDLNKDEMLTYLIDRYADLQRIKNASDLETELDYQIQIVKAKLEACGIVTEKLDYKR